MKIEVLVADESHAKFAQAICDEVFVSAQERGTGIAKRTPEYIIEKMKAGKAVIAVADGEEFAGFSYIESWGGKQFVANSGLIVAHKFRGLGLAKLIKKRIFDLSREKFPDAKIFSITTSPAVMKMNLRLGYVPVTLGDLTKDDEFWKGCEGCCNYDVLCRNGRRICLCTGMMYDPKAEQKKAKKCCFKKLFGSKK